MIKSSKNLIFMSLAYMAFSGGQAQAALIDDGTWNGWTAFNDNPVMYDNGPGPEDLTAKKIKKVDPGYGGQRFDAEYLLYKVEGNILHIGLQTGFDIIDGHQPWGSSQDYWAGDLALSFDGLGASGKEYEYGIDFIDFGANKQCGYSAVSSGTCATNLDLANGVYAVDTWNTDVYTGHHVSDPFAIGTTSAGPLALIDNLSGSQTYTENTKERTSYYRKMSFDITALEDLVATDNIINGGNITFDAHWTMSCGNDEINGTQTANVPEPSAIALLGLGLVGLGLMRRRGRGV